MENSSEIFKLEKAIWNELDYEKMEWHDCSIHGIAFERRENEWGTDLIFDIDYIFQWVKPKPPEKSFSFWVAPCTLVFKDVFGLKMDIDMQGSSLQERLEIASLNLVEKIEREKGVITYRWNLELQEGAIKFESYGYDQIVRQKPLHISGQQLSLEQRKNINFRQIPATGPF